HLPLHSLPTRRSSDLTDSSPYKRTPAHAFIWDHAKLIDLGDGSGDGVHCGATAEGINDAGVVVGAIYRGVDCGERQIYLWDGRMRVIGCPVDTTYCTPRGINARGDVDGYAIINVAIPTYAFLYRDGTFQ